MEKETIKRTEKVRWNRLLANDIKPTDGTCTVLFELAYKP